MGAPHGGPHGIGKYGALDILQDRYYFLPDESQCGNTIKMQ